MFYTVYQILNKINGKVYVGKHMTKDLNDGYMGSGKLIKTAIKKYGIHNFIKIIIGVYDNEALMNAAEKFIVASDADFTYNLCDGGKGGWGYVNKNKKAQPKRAGLALAQKILLDKNLQKQYQLHGLLYGSKNLNPYNNKSKRFAGKSHKQSSKDLISNSMKGKQIGSKNSQFGTMWITNNLENKKIKKTDPIPEQWRRGRANK